MVQCFKETNSELHSLSLRYSRISNIVELHKIILPFWPTTVFFYFLPLNLLREFKYSLTNTCTCSHPRVSPLFQPFTSPIETVDTLQAAAAAGVGEAEDGDTCSPLLAFTRLPQAVYITAKTGKKIIIVDNVAFKKV